MSKIRTITIRYLFRSLKLHSFSVERVFSTIIPYVQKKYNVENAYMPEYKITIINLLNNLLYTIMLYINSQKYDIFHITGDITYTSILLPSNRTILTVLDTVSLKNNNGIKKWLLKFFWYYLPLRKCKYITVISEKTKSELCNLFPFCEKKITVVHCPVDSSFTPVTKQFNKEKPILLQVGTKDNKNLRRVVEAIKGINCELFIVGKLSQSDLNCLSDSGVVYKNFYNLSNDEVVMKYQECDILIFASTYEGFGMPILEAQSCGKPVITSNLDPMVSVSGGGACFVNPFDSNSIRDGIEKVINDDKLREDITTKGFSNCSMYSPAIISNQYIRIYNRVIETSL